MLSALLVASTAFAPAAQFARPNLAVASRHVVPQQIMPVVNAVKDSILPPNSDKTLRNVFGVQALGWGAAGLLAPAYLCTNVLGVTGTPLALSLMRGMALGNLCLAGRFFGGSDADAAAGLL